MRYQLSWFYSAKSYQSLTFTRSNLSGWLKAIQWHNIGKSPTGSGVRTRYYFTQFSGGGTSISGTDDNGKTLTYTDGEYVDVYLNGVLLVHGTDYGTGTANTISSLAALASGDVVEVVVYDIFNVAKINNEAVRKRYYKTASGSETSISGADDSGATITFPANAEIGGEAKRCGTRTRYGLQHDKCQHGRRSVGSVCRTGGRDCRVRTVCVG